MADTKSYFDFVLPLVKEAGRYFLQSKNDNIQVENKSAHDLVTKYDKDIEDILIKRIKEKYPDHEFIGEESSELKKQSPILTNAPKFCKKNSFKRNISWFDHKQRTSFGFIGEEESSAKNNISTLTNDPTWIIDPIDGTANFVKRMPITCISVGMTIDKEQILGVIYNPYIDELFTAIKGQRAHLNGEKIQCSKVTEPKMSLFGYEVAVASKEGYHEIIMKRLSHFIKNVQAVRAFGCPILAQCYVASGKLDAYQCDGLYPWDAAAGTLIVKEAGWCVIIFIGEEESSAKNNISTLTNDPTWIIDPIDGTANFVKRMPITCISVGMTIDKEQILGVIYNPYMDELFTAIKGQRAHLNGEKIQCSKVTEPKMSLFGYEVAVASKEGYHEIIMKRLSHFIKNVQAVRAFGCPILAQCYVASGKLDAYQCDGLYPWDAAAGTLIVKEAGWCVIIFIGEEESSAKNNISTLTNDPNWIIDPIDGTANFVKRMPITCISVGMTIDKEQILGVIYNPYMDELFTAIKGQRAHLNGEKIQCSKVTEPKMSLFGYEVAVASKEGYHEIIMKRLSHFIKNVQAVRAFGCPILAQCYVASGKLDAYQCDGLYPWDAAAGTLIVKEAGGCVKEPTEKKFDLMEPSFLVACTKELCEKYVEIVRRADEERENQLNKTTNQLIK